MVPLALVANLATRWHHLHWFQSWPPGNVTCIATLPWIALLALSVSIEFVSSSARVTSVKFAQGIVTYLLRDNRIHRSDQGHLGPIIRTHVNKVCSVWPLNLDWDTFAFLNIRFAIFLKNRLIFPVNMHFLICCKSVQNLVIRSCHLHCLVPNLATRLCHSCCQIALECPMGIID